MFANLVKPSSRYIPYAVGAATLALGASYTIASARYNVASNTTSRVLSGDDRWVDLPISHIEKLSHDTRRFTFKLPSEDDMLGTEYTSAILTKFVTPKGSNVVRPYTPVSPVEEKGQFQLVIKHYDGGKMSEHLFGLKENDTVSFKGPIKKWKWAPNSFKEVTLIGGGTGITPLFQLIRAVCENPEDKTTIKLYYGSKTPQDILLKKELDEFQKKFPDQLKVNYFVDKADNDFTGEVGYITKDFVSKNSAKPSNESHVFVCGPPPFMDAVSGQKKSPSEQGELKGLLKELGYTSDNVFKY